MQQSVLAVVFSLGTGNFTPQYFSSTGKLLEKAKMLKANLQWTNIPSSGEQ